MKKDDKQVPGKSTDSPSKGLGDTVGKLIDRVTMGKIKECKPCEERRAKLNKHFPYKNREKE
ncbi:TPA: hypothetical protein HA278_07580 [Candidatus Woesearchaeota archaeon]|jgi:hypothetical protein|nr:hypothetical protein [Candidatus Woesearchaeota archaeon]